MPLKKMGFGVKLSMSNRGLTIVTKHFPGKTVKVGLVVRNGAFYDPPGKSGLAHLVEHCIFDGVKSQFATIKLPITNDHEISWIIEGAGAISNGLNSYQNVTYTLDCTKTDLSSLLKIVLMMVLLPKLSDRSIRNQKNIVCAEISRDNENMLYGDDDNSTSFAEITRKLLFPNSPVSNPQPGIKKDVLTIAPSEVRKTYGEFYRPNEMALVVLGNFNHSEVVEMVRQFEEEFGDALPKQSKNIQRIRAGSIKNGLKGRQVGILKGERFEHVVMNIAFRAPVFLSRNYIPIKILHGVLGGFTFSRLYNHFREKLGQSYFAETRYFATSLHGEFIVHLNLQPKAKDSPTKMIEEAENFIIEQIKDIGDGKIGEREFEQAKIALYNFQRKYGLEDHQFFMDLLVRAVESNDYNGSGTISRNIERELAEAPRIRNCSIRRFVSAVKKEIDLKNYVMVASGPSDHYQPNPA